MARLQQADKIQPHWWRKTLIGLFLGLTLAYGLIASFAWFGPGGIDADVKVQFNMWMVAALWMLILPFIYLFKTAQAAFKYMLLANALAYGLFFVLGGVS
ncbi:hypothetical protein HR060_14420 [Catenovulum sp. SM1970]|uniref:hypothetical protein n=1 Tax=Marinifaba aquimaris TaxID=2741323 RepID=UPI00157354E9|nr:hypothetical protein [Marinifaba aquimaris]NTS78051.1 hypothetical protein [Marinifaba aquimaris]